MQATDLTKTNFVNSIQSGVALVDFWAVWCGPCRVQSPIVDELADEMNGQVVIAKVNVDEQPELAAQFAIRSIPTLLLFKDGKVAETLVGIHPKQVLKDKLLKLAN